MQISLSDDQFSLIGARNHFRLSCGMTKINNRRINYASNLSPDAPHHALFTSISVETRRVKMSQFLSRLLSDDYVTVEK